MHSALLRATSFYEQAFADEMQVAENSIS